eukprot:TRINITY_DN1940_c0_g1_i9.p2 TRINITY_DN1940_c0_g1~~TRINITY_DN1940_c0_g1_i9.p2  ORF type:complete len:106 (+),score=46.68 TRINITY_DN1940_c0_g1_i9:46-363(+)
MHKCQYFFFLMIRRPPRSTQSRSSAASDVYKRQIFINKFPNFVFQTLSQILQFGQVSHNKSQYQFGSNSLQMVFQLITSNKHSICLLYTSPSPRDRQKSRMPSSA